MWEIPLSLGIIMVGLGYLQDRHHSYLREIKNIDLGEKHSTNNNSLEKEFEDYKKRVDVLSLKAGFKL